PSYGYHFDAYKLGDFLRGWATRRGVEHLPLEVEEIEIDEKGEVAALLCEGGERVAGDIFVDCSGFRAMIAQEALGATFLPFAENLFADSAVVMPTPLPDTFRPQTEAIAMRAGWRWHIPLTTRVGNGYVYSSRFITDEEAEAELRAAIGTTDSETPARFLKMKVGRLENSWTGNCLAAGLAQGFIEPLEATALHIVIATALEFADAFEQGGFTAQHRDTFNRRIAARYDGIRDYIVGHYRLNQRTDTPFWRDNAANQTLPGGLKAMMTAWFTHKDIAEAVAALGPVEAYPAMSWHCLFAGYGTFPAPGKMQPPPPGSAPADIERIRAIIAACAQNFATLSPR
ncbi:MAG: tryptophan 7-halogenase, partial [Erythrobacter sp.]|nr:tryptophan 7-halogenase [Erythrobacter sp.]